MAKEKMLCGEERILESREKETVRDVYSKGCNGPLRWWDGSFGRRVSLGMGSKTVSEEKCHLNFVTRGEYDRLKCKVRCFFLPVILSPGHEIEVTLF